MVCARACPLWAFLEYRTALLHPIQRDGDGGFFYAIRSFHNADLPSFTIHASNKTCTRDMKGGRQ
jgi:hypothetical protein